jgi:type II secretory ATPase GspE/PulE/Tfp pilus assembly ATPase PilB-like protein
VFGPRVILQVVRDSEARLPLEKIGFDFDLLARYRDALEDLRGLVLVGGPRASGVTTTLYSTLNALDPVRLNLCTLEADIHFNLPGINQFSPATCGVADRAAALDAVLRLQPDVVALDGCLRGAAAETALEAARDGCLVLAQTPGLDAADAIARLAAHVARDDLASALRMVLVQRLVRVVCPHCRFSYEPPASLRRRITETVGPVEGYVKGKGCAACAQTGFLGQIGLFELVLVEPDLAERISGGAADPAALRAAIRETGHPSLWVDGMNKVRAGITTVEEVMDVLAGCPCEPPANKPSAVSLS